MQTMNLGASLRDRAFRCNLRFAPISAAIPRASAPCGRCALRLPGGSLRSPPLPVRRRGGKARPHRPPDRRSLLAPALRAALVGDFASLALAGCAGRGTRLGFVPGTTPCLAGAGCASHRLRHCAVHEPQRRCLRSCARSCGALPHFAPHRAVPRRPHRCGHRRLRPRQRAAHVCPRLRAHRPPLTRRGGSPPPASPASIPPSLLPRALPFPTARGRPWLSHPTHRWCTAPLAAHAASRAVTAVIVHIPARPWRAGKSASDLRRSPKIARQFRVLAGGSPGLALPRLRLASLLRRRQARPDLRRLATVAGHRRNCDGPVTRLRRFRVERQSCTGS